MTLITFAVLQGCLGLGKRIPRSLLVVLIASPRFTVPIVIGFLPPVSPFYITMVSAMLGYSLWLTAALLLVRRRGYRLVRLQTVRSIEKSAYAGTTQVG